MTERDCTGSGEPTRHPVQSADLVPVLAVLGRYEAEMRGGALDDSEVESLGRHLQRVGLITDRDRRDHERVAEALGEVGQRLRQALGEYADDPVGDDQQTAGPE